MEVIGESTVYRNPHPTFCSEVVSASCCCWTGGSEDPRILCAFRIGEAKMSREGRLRVRASRDLGQTWFDEPGPALSSGSPFPINEFSFQVGADRSGMAVLAAARMRMAEPDDDAWSDEAAGITDADAVFARQAAGNQWQPAVVLDFRRHPDEWAIPCGPPLALGAGRWIAPMERHARTHEAGWLREYHAFTIRSDDDGLTWDRPRPTLNDPDRRLAYYDQQMTVLANGRILSLAWVHDVDEDTTLPARGGFSDDEGETWSAPFETGLVGGPLTPIRLRDGRLLAVFGRRTPPTGIRACVSDDDGLTWPSEGEFVIYDEASRTVVGQMADRTKRRGLDAKLWQTMWGWTFGTPTPALLPDGSVVVTFYATGFDAVTEMRSVRLLP